MRPEESSAAERGECGDHLDGSEVTVSVWELRRMDGSEGSVPGHFRRRMGLFGTRVRVWDSKADGIMDVR